jgi:Uma2 family endonuclease
VLYFGIGVLRADRAALAAVREPGVMPMTTQPVQQRRDEDQRVILHRVSWEHFELLLGIRGDDPAVRVTYLGGELELMSPSRDHEWEKTVIARLIEAYAVERHIVLEGFGSWTLREAPRAAGAEPDECYILGHEPKDRPDLVLEVVRTSGGIDKLEVYSRLRVAEVWFWREGRISVHLLGPDGYRTSARSAAFPDLDMERFASFVHRPTQTQAVNEFLAWLRV